jgi:hypothetical protein
MKFPNVFRFFLAGLRTGYAKLRGYRVLVNEEEEQHRWRRCEICPHRINGPELIGDQCALCTCLLDAKLLLTMEKCPDGRWKRIWRKSPN